MFRDFTEMKREEKKREKQPNLEKEEKKNLFIKLFWI